MKKYIVDLTDTASFKGIIIWYPYLREGLEYAKEINVSKVQIRSEENLKRKINFDILAQYDFIQTLHWLVPLHKQSNIEGLYCLRRLEDFAWSPFCDMPIDFSKLTTIKKLNTRYTHSMFGWDKLESLNFLFLSKVCTQDLSFLKHNVNLEYLRLLRGSFNSIHGIDDCVKLRTLFLQSCKFVETLEPTIYNLKLERLNIERCPKIVLNERIRGFVKNIAKL